MSSRAHNIRKRTAEKVAEVPEKRKPTSIMEREISIDFTDSNTVHDRILLVGNKKFYVVSGNLALYSNYFNRIFTGEYKEKEEKESKLEDVDAIDFKNFLITLSFVKFEIKEKNVHGLLKVADRFESPVVWQKCWDFILSNKNIASLFPVQTIDWMSQNMMIISDEVEDKVASAMNRYKFHEIHSEKFKNALETVKNLRLPNLKTVLEESLIHYLETPRPDPEYYRKHKPLLPPPCNVIGWSFEYELEGVKEFYKNFLGTVKSADDVYTFFDRFAKDIRSLSEEIQKFIYDIITPLLDPSQTRLNEHYMDPLDKIKP